MKKGQQSNKVFEALKKWDINASLMNNAINLGWTYSRARNFRMNQGLPCVSEKVNKYEAVIKAWDSSKTVMENAVALKMSYPSANTLKRNYGLECITEHQRKRNLIDYDRVVKFCVKEGLDYEAIGRMLRISRQRVEQIYKGLKA